MYRNAGENVDETLEGMNIDHYAQAGVYYIQIVFHVGAGATALTVSISKEVNETFAEAFERNFAEGLIDPIGTDETPTMLTHQDLRDFIRVFPEFGYRASSGSTAVFGGRMGGTRTGHVTIEDCPGGICGEEEPQPY